MQPVAKIETICCDNCGKQKGENNHWWSIWANSKTKSMFITPFGNNVNIMNYMGKDDGMIRLDACGLECCNKLEEKIKEGKNPLK